MRVRASGPTHGGSFGATSQEACRLRAPATGAPPLSAPRRIAIRSAQPVDFAGNGPIPASCVTDDWIAHIQHLTVAGHVVEDLDDPPEVKRRLGHSGWRCAGAQRRVRRRNARARVHRESRRRPSRVTVATNGSVIFDTLPGDGEHGPEGST